MCPPPKPKKPPIPPPPIEAPEVELGNENPSAESRRAKSRGRNQLRTGLTIPSALGGGGLTIPT
jgi:hypothetical protein